MIILVIFHILSNIYYLFFSHHSRDFFYREPTIGTTIVVIEANNDTYCLQKRIEKLPLVEAPEILEQYKRSI